jgi:hypothetical protein
VRARLDEEAARAAQSLTSKETLESYFARIRILETEIQSLAVARDKLMSENKDLRDQVPAVLLNN